VFNYRGQSIRNHNRLLGNVEGVDGIKTGYTRASGFNLVTSMRRGNRHLIGVVLGGRSGGSRDATMRNLLAENLEKAATTRTVAAITERNSADANTDVADAAPASRTAEPVQLASAEQASAQATRSIAPAKPSLMAAAAAALPPPQAKSEPSKFEPQAKPEPAPLTSGVIQTQAISAIPGSAEPMKPVKVRTVQVKAGQMKLASAGPSQPAPPVTNAIPPAHGEVAETSSAVVAKAETKPEMTRPEVTRAELPPQPANHGTGNGVLGVLPASSVATPPSQALAYADPAPRAQPQTVQQNAAIKPAAVAAAHTGWIIQVGALESESEARARIDLARNQARGLLGKADSFTEPVVAKDNRKLFRARFAGLERDQAEAICRTLKRADISCITVRN
jgi:D-alanyl-D-alanine carboxypeptidase